MSPGPARTALLLVLITTLHSGGGRPEPLWAQAGERCVRAERFLVREMGMAAVVEADSLDDWRTGRVLPGCRITAAGTTKRELAEAASRLYDELREAGWTRTPDPRDAPGESSLRLRRAGEDCLFNVYAGVLLGTEAELEVSAARTPGPGRSRINVLVLCVPVAEARPGAVYILLAPGNGRTLLFSGSFPGRSRQDRPGRREPGPRFRRGATDTWAEGRAGLPSRPGRPRPGELLRLDPRSTVSGPL